MGIQINGTTDTISAVDGSLDINQNATFGNNVTIGGTLTYSDVTNIDSVGLVTAKNGLRIHAGGLDLTSGISTFSDNIQIADKIIHKDDVNTAIRFPATDTISAETSGLQRLRIQSTGQLLYSAASGDNIITSKRTNAAGSNGNYFFHLKATDNNDNNVGEFGFHRDTAVDDSRFIVKTRNTGGSSTERLRITSAGSLLVGADAVEDWNGSRSHRLQVRGTSSNNSGISILATQNDDNPCELVLGKSRGTGDTIVGSADDVGQIRWSANDGAGFHSIAWIRGAMDGTPGSDDLPSKLTFGTSADGGTTVSERLRITSAGIIQCGTSGVLKAEINNAVSGHQFISQCSDNNNGFEIYQQHGSTATRNTLAVYDNRGGSASKQLAFAVRGDGLTIHQGAITFKGETAAVNQLDDYETGTWTPYFGTSGDLQLTATYTTQSGSYTKIGNLVFVMFDIIVSNTPSGTAGYPLISGLPFAPLIGQSTQGGFPVPSFRSMSAAPADMRAYGTDSYGHSTHSSIWIAYYNSSGVSQQPAGGTFWTSGRMTGNLTYRTTA